jgi:hypothetical protein
VHLLSDFHLKRKFRGIGFVEFEELEFGENNNDLKYDHSPTWMILSGLCFLYAYFVNWKIQFQVKNTSVTI